MNQPPLALSWLRRHRRGLFLFLTALNVGLAFAVFTGQTGAQNNADERAELEQIILDAHDAYLAGNYRQASRPLERILRDEADDILTRAEYDRVATLLARVYFDDGNYDGARTGALRVLRPRLAPNRPLSGDTGRAMALEYARILHYTGQLDLAREITARVQIEFPDDIENLALIGQLNYQSGHEDEAMTAFNRLIMSIRNRPELFDGQGEAFARRWHAAGKAYYFADRIVRESRLNDALNCFNRARRADPTYLENLAWGGKVSIDGNQQAQARQLWLLPALKQNTNYAPARAQLARSWFFEWSAYRGASEAWTAYRLSPKSIEALMAMVESKITDQRYSQCVEYIDKALEINPVNLEVLSLKALVQLYTGDAAGYAATEKRVLELNAKYSEFYAVVAEGLKEQHRFDEAIREGEKGLKLDPSDWDIFKTLGFVYARMGQNAKAKEYLVEANRRDPLRNNLYTLNLLQALKVIEEEFAEYPTPDGRFIIRAHKNEAGWLMPLLERDLQRSWDALCEKYGYEPKTPIVFECFHRVDDFAARSIALPNIPALGVCFGQYITMNSPTSRQPGQFSWAKTLRHEMDHIYQIQLSNGRVPRWLAEGCSVYEERRTRPEWDREMDEQMIQFYHQDQLLKLGDINKGFRNMGTIMFAYYQSSYMVEFIDKHLGGMGKVAQMLRDFAHDRSIEQVIRDNFGISLDEFDTRFRAYIKREFIDKTKMMPFYGPDHLQQFKLDYEDNPEDANLRAKLGAAYNDNGMPVDAKLHTGIALRLDPNNVLAIVTMGRILFREASTRNDDEAMMQAIDLYERALRAGVEDFHLYRDMAQIYLREGDDRAAIEFLRMAKEAFPRYIGEGNPYHMLAQIYQQQGNMPAVLREIEAYCAINELDVQSRQQLATFYQRSGNVAKALQYWEEIEAVVPQEIEVHLTLGGLLMRARRYDDAAVAYRVILGFRSFDHETRARYGLVEALYRAKRFEEALTVAEQIITSRPTDTAAQQWKARLEAAKDGRDNPDAPLPRPDFRPDREPPSRPDEVPPVPPDPQNPNPTPNPDNQPPNTDEEF